MHTQGRILVAEASDGMFWRVESEAGEAFITGGYEGEVTVGHEDSYELVRRWNAFEEGGAVERAIDSFERIQLLIDTATSERRRLTASETVDIYEVALTAETALGAARAALVEPGAEAGREPQG